MRFTPNTPNNAGKSTREMARKRGLAGVWILLIAFVVVVVAGFVLQNSNALGIGGTGIVILFLAILFVPNLAEGLSKRKFKEEKRATRGAVAEEKVGDILDELLAISADDYLVLHDVKCPYGNIDHIVICRAGPVFLIETKAHGGRVEVQGDILLINDKNPEKNFISQTLRNTYWLRDEINTVTGTTPWITPIIVFSNAFVKPSKPIKGIRIINKKYLLQVITGWNHPNSLPVKAWEQKEKILSRFSSE